MKSREVLPPLDGFLVVDMTEVWAGPMTGSMLGDLGATVIKLESFPRPSLTRLKGQAVGYSGNDADAPRPWDRAALHNMANRNKLGITLNLKDPRGMALFEKLMGKADALLTSFTAGTAARLGVDYASVVKMNPNTRDAWDVGLGRRRPVPGLRRPGERPGRVYRASRHARLPGYRRFDHAANSAHRRYGFGDGSLRHSRRHLPPQTHGPGTVDRHVSGGDLSSPLGWAVHGLCDERAKSSTVGQPSSSPRALRLLPVPGRGPVACCKRNVRGGVAGLLRCNGQ